MAVKKTLGKATALSEEYIADSSDDDKIPEPKTRIKAPSKSSNKIPNYKKDFDSASTPESETESSEGSESAEVDKDVVEEQAEGGSSDDESEVNQDDEYLEDSEEDEDKDEDHGSGFASETSASKTVVKKRMARAVNEDAPPSKRPKSTTHIPNMIAAKPFVPPKGFEKLALSTTRLQSPAFLSESGSKQVWYFTAPSSLSLEPLGSLDMEAVSEGQPVIKQDGIVYGFSPSQQKYETLLLSEGDDGHYFPKPARIVRSFHLQEMSAPKASSSALSPTSSAKLNFTATSPGEKKAVRAQPDGLRMRYQPFGSMQTTKLSTHPTTPPETAKKTKKPKRREQLEDSAKALEVAENPLVSATKSTAKLERFGESGTSETVLSSVNSASEIKDKKKKKKKKSVLVDEASI